VSAAIDTPVTFLPMALVGFMGAGKSTIGRLVAARLSVSFVDCDLLIEQRHGDIAEIFATHGEQVFRRLERDVVCAALAAAVKRPSVISLGGGAVMSGDVREALLRLPHVIWLTAPADVLWQRVRGHGSSRRPLVADEQGFRRLLEERSALYAAVATATVANDGSATSAAIADAIASLATDPTASAGRRA
jgi:shikimate kinase